MKMFGYDPSATLIQRSLTDKQWTIRAPMLALTNPDPALALPAGTTLQPAIFLRNVSGNAYTAQLTFNWRSDSNTGKTAVPLQPYATTMVDVAALQKNRTIPTAARWAYVSITAPIQPDNLLAVATSFDATGRLGAQTPFSDQVANHWEGGKWEVDVTIPLLPTSTERSEGQGTQTPSLAPRAPPSRLKPEMEQEKVVVFLHERKQGAGHQRRGGLGQMAERVVLIRPGCGCGAGIEGRLGPCSNSWTNRIARWFSWRSVWACGLAKCWRCNGADFNFANLTILVQRGIVHGHVDVVKTEYSNDDLPLDADLCAILQRWKQQCPVTPDGWAFPNPATLKPYWQESVCADRIKPAAVKAGVGTNIGWHTFRHTYRTWLDSTGAPIAMQRELMRHASIGTTMNVYGRAVMSDAKRQANSKVVQMALRPVLSTKAESGASGKAPPLNAPLSSLAGGSRSTANI